MDILTMIKNRHSVRRYTDKKIEGEVLSALQAEISARNAESGLNIQLVTDEPQAFGGFMAHYGNFSGVKNYIALIGKKRPDLDEKIGYYGERIALKAQQLGLNTCWVALTFSKGKCGAKINKGEKLVCVLAVGYGENQGVPHKSKPIESLCKVNGTMPDWFRSGMEAAMLAPTAMNQQKFLITLSGNKVKAESTGGFYSKVDLGIVKYHFEIGAGKENFEWTKD
ncbi:nitroreductase family protein [Petroclostridium xylanilyticum]|uniref:nitroreductase family protein n=1 Tax=Petroclostridium xylanilyticum TaxID=1792311 RepID=UPI000B992F36|nr:nitroreductase family protein [Petroclostridium xylanilyticum]